MTSYDSERERDAASSGSSSGAPASFGKRTLTEGLPRRAASPESASPRGQVRTASGEGSDIEDPFGMHLIGASAKHGDGGLDEDGGGDGGLDGGGDHEIEDAGARDVNGTAVAPPPLADGGGSSPTTPAVSSGGATPTTPATPAVNNSGATPATPATGNATGPAPGNSSTPAPAGPRPRPANLRNHRTLRVPSVSGSFLGGRVDRAHPVLMERLQRAEAHLTSTVTPPPGQTLRQALGIHEGYLVRRNDHSYHSVGLAIDINYRTNPYVGGDAEVSRQVNQQSLAVIWRATWLAGQGAAVSPADSDARAASDSTAALYDHFASADRALELYLTADLAQVTAWITAGNLTRVPAPPPRLSAAMLAQGRLATADAAQWLAQARDDRRLIRGSGPSNWMQGNYVTGSMRPMSEDAGFMDLDRRLVLALRDVGGLAWGASDFGGGANGDFMHFDCRYDYSAADVAAYHATAAAPGTGS